MVVKGDQTLLIGRSTTIIYCVCSFAPQKNETISAHDRVLTGQEAACERGRRRLRLASLSGNRCVVMF